MRAVEDAIARQVFHGGDLVTNLLEIGAAREDLLVQLVAESHGLDPAPPGRLRLPAPEVLRLVPGDLALRHGMFPLSQRDRALVVAVAEPLPGAVEDDLGFALDVAIRQVIAPLVRIRQAIAEGYGIPLDRRFVRLQAKLDGGQDPSPSAVPPPDLGLVPARMPRPVSIPVPSFGTGVPGSDSEPARLDAKPAAKTPFVPRHHFVDPAIPRSPPVPARLGEGRPVAEAPEVADPSGPSGSSGLPDPPAAEGALVGHAVVDVTAAEASVAAPAAAPAAPEVPASAPAPLTAAATRALAGVLRQALRAERTVDKTSSDARPKNWKPAQARRKGPFTTAMAEQELEEATASDDVLAILFAFAQQFFQYAALFVVHGDLAEGRDAAGAGADRAAVAGIGVPLDLPSSLATARERRGPVLAPLAPDGLDADLARDLGRGPFATPRAAALLPVVVRSRAVAIVYGDDGDADVELSSIGDVIGLAGLAGAALERIALRKKLGARAPEVPLKVRIQDGAAALARAIAASAAQVAASAHAEAPSAASPEPPTIAEPPRHATVRPRSEAMSEARSEARSDPPEAPVDSVARLAAALVAGSTARKASPVATGGSPGLPDGTPAPAPDEENPLAIPPGPRTARYFEEPPPFARTTDVGIGIRFPDEPEDSGLGPWTEAPVESAPDTPPPRAFDSWMPIYEPPPAAPVEPAPLSRPQEPPPTVRKPTPLRRGPAPLYEGRAAALPEGASVEWVGGPAPDPEVPDAPADAEPRRERARTLPSMGLGPLPPTPPPNATAWTSFPSPPPPPSLGAMGALGAMPTMPAMPAAHGQSRATARPIPREEQDDPDEGHGFFNAPSDRVLFAADPPLPSVVVDLVAEHNQLIQRVIDGGRRGQEAFDELVRNGEHVVQAVMARFPGPLRVDRHRARGELPAASQCGPILELVVAIRRNALPFVSVRTSAQDPEVRFWATHVLGELRYAEAATVLVPRLFDDDAQVRRIARRSAAALVGAGAAGAPILRGLADITGNPDQPRPHRALAIETMGEIRSGSLVPPLLAALDDPAEEIAEAARRALLLITRQDFGRDSRLWHTWWAQNGGRHRIEWLIDALMHDQPQVRRAAGDELKLLTKEYFGYYDDLPRRERERAQGLYRAWWEREGRPRFS